MMKVYYRSMARIPLMGVFNYLLSKGGWLSDLNSIEEIMVSGHAGLKHKHASIEVNNRPWTHFFFGPMGRIGALLAVPDLILWGVAPSLLTEAVHHSIKIAVGQVKQMVNVFIHLDVPIQVYHLVELHKLSSNEKAMRKYVKKKIQLSSEINMKKL